DHVAAVIRILYAQCQRVRLDDDGENLERSGCAHSDVLHGALERRLVIEQTRVGAVAPQHHRPGRCQDEPGSYADKMPSPHGRPQRGTHPTTPSDEQHLVHRGTLLRGSFKIKYSSFATAPV